MSSGMLGMLKLSEVQGLRADLEEKLASDSGEKWRNELKKFLRKEHSWVGDRIIYPAQCTNLMKAIELGQKSIRNVFADPFEEAEMMPGDFNGPIWNMFNLPETLPWKKVMAIFQPANTTYRDCIEAVKTSGGFKVKEVPGIDHCTNAEKSERLRLFLMEFSKEPSKDTMGHEPHKLFTGGRKFLGLGAYVLAVDHYYGLTSGDQLDVETTTIFPRNGSFGGRGVLVGNWNEPTKEICFETMYTDGNDPFAGAREVIEVPLRR